MTREGYKRYAFNIGSAIRERRCAIGMTRMQLAHIVGTHKKTIEKWENDGQRPRYEALYKIADALNCMVDELFEVHTPIQPERKPEPKKMPSHIEKCIGCVWGRYEQNVIFCTSAAGTCLKEELNHENPGPVSSCNTDDADISGVHLAGEG